MVLIKAIPNKALQQTPKIGAAEFNR